MTKPDKVACIYLYHSCPLRVNGWACPSFDQLCVCEEEMAEVTVHNMTQALVTEQVKKTAAKLGFGILIDMLRGDSSPKTEAHQEFVSILNAITESTPAEIRAKYAEMKGEEK